MRLCPSASCRFARLIFTVTLLYVWTGAFDWAGSAARAQTPAGPAVPAEPKSDAERLLAIANGIDQYAKLISVVKTSVDRKTFDPQAVVDAVGSDPAKLAEWVAQNTGYIPYAGSLRGPAGVLMDRTGNSVDRALLLGKLLQLAKVSVRLAHGKLADAQVKELLQRPAAPHTEPAAAEDPEKVIAQIAAANGMTAAQVREVMESQQAESDKAAEKLVESVTDQSARLTALLGKGISATVPDVAENNADAADHWWVQFDSAGKWVDADPQAPKLTAAQAYCDASETVELPQDPSKLLVERKLMHEVGVRVRIERMGAKGAEQLTVMDRSFAVAQLSGKSLNFSMIPLQWPGEVNLSGADGADKLKATLLAQHAWLPMFIVDGQSLFDSSFDDTGKLDPKPRLDGLGQAGKTVGTKAQGAADLFDDAPATASQVLTSAWLEFDIKSPNHPTQTVRRDVYDFFKAAQRKAGLPAGLPVLGEKDNLARSAALFRSMDLLPTGCVLSQGFVTSVAINETQRTSPILRDALRQAAGGAAEPAIQKISQVHSEPMTLLALASLRTGPAGLATGMALDHPNLFARQHGLTLRNDGSIGATDSIDIVSNGVGVRPGADSFARQLRQGVMETYLEGLLLAPSVQYNTAAIYRASAAQNVHWKVYKNGEDTMAASGLSEATRGRIAADLAAGFIVVAPEKTVTVSKHTYEGWWRIDPKTGNTVGYMANGMGAATVEYSTLLTAIAVGGFTFIGCGGIGAVAAGNAVKALGCLACAVAVGALTYFAGLAAIASAEGTAVSGAVKFAGGLGGFRAGAAGTGICTIISVT